MPEPLSKQVKRLADVIMFEIPGEPSRSEGAIDCAIRLLRAAHAPQPPEGLAERAEKAETALARAYERIDTWRATCEQRIEDAERMKAAILDIDAHATPLAADKQGFVAGGYIISVGSLHRALGVIGHPAAKCLRCTPESHDCAEQFIRDRQEGHVTSDPPIIRNPLHSGATGGDDG